ncbi:unnamed protein product, partial [Brugia timori]|uniref:Fibronectin type-II domain-containing protein n=1 Tax=Brugia timori TaxID=42155 RepID=A0A0R3QC24_9BILA
RKECFSAEACYDQREPEAWCILNENQSWIDKGCFCDAKLHSCVIERNNSGRLEYSYCTPEKGWECSYNDRSTQDGEGGSGGDESVHSDEYDAERGYDGDDSAKSDYMKREFIKTDGKKKKCFSAEACYDQREPQAWCMLNVNQSWTDKGCFCDANLHSCVIERKNNGRLEYSYCVPEEGWKCSYTDRGANVAEDEDSIASGNIVNGGDRSTYSDESSANDENDGDDGAGTRYHVVGEDYVKRKFVETDGKRKECFSAKDCYDQREPEAWCILQKNQSWTYRGCFCDSKLHSCVIERKNSGRLEYSYCVPEEGWKCSYSDVSDGGKYNGNNGAGSSESRTESIYRIESRAGGQHRSESGAGSVYRTESLGKHRSESFAAEAHRSESNVG